MKNGPVPVFVSLVTLMVGASLLCSCGSSTATGTAPLPLVDSANTVTVTGITAGGASERFVGLDSAGQVVFGPVTLSHQVAQRLEGLPGTTCSLRIEQLSAAGEVIGEFVTQLDLLEKAQIILSAPAFVSTLDSTAYRFVFFGCNRVSGSGAKDNPSTANRAQLSADFSEIANMSPAPKYLFMTGDLVLNEVAGSATLQSQLTSWVQEFQQGPLPASSVQLCAMTGNHEVLVQTGSSEETELPNPSTLPVWVQTMAPFIRGSNGPTLAAPNSDLLTQDQSHLSYTFQDGEIGFMVVNTDTFTTANVNSQVPLNWISQQMDALQSNPGIQHIFVVGHRPISSPDPDNLGIQPQQASVFQSLLTSHSKVRAYLCAHAHLWNSQNLSGLPQIIAGNGGSTVEKKFAKHNAGYYGYTVVHLKKSGKIHVESWGRPIPSPYDSTDSQPATSLREKFSL